MAIPGCFQLFFRKMEISAEIEKLNTHDIYSAFVNEYAINIIQNKWSAQVDLNSRQTRPSEKCIVAVLSFWIGTASGIG